MKPNIRKHQSQHDTDTDDGIGQFDIKSKLLDNYTGSYKRRHGHFKYRNLKKYAFQFQKMAKGDDNYRRKKEFE